MSKTLFNNIKKIILEIKDRNPFLALDDCFLVWFINYLFTTKEKEAVDATKGKSGDKGIDAIYINHEFNKVYLFQGKYRQKLNEYSEKREDVLALASSGRILLQSTNIEASALFKKTNSLVKKSLKEVYTLIHNKSYELILCFVTSGKISDTIIDEADEQIESFNNVKFEAFSGHDLIRHMHDYLVDLSPPLPTTILKISGNEVFDKFDEETGINSWIFSINLGELSKLYNDPNIGSRLFARNIRGYQGETDINEGIKNTIENNSAYFWYFNNGVTIVCDSAKGIEQKGAKFIRIKNMQIINGQQTTITASKTKAASTVSVIVRLFALPREKEQDFKSFEELVNNLVASTNWQNAISQSDLRSNDLFQVSLQKKFRILNYLYLRKKRTAKEVKLIFGNKYIRTIKKEYLAKIASSCLLDPIYARRGKERLFEDPTYSEIFEDRTPYEFLTFYWLHGLVKYVSSGDPRKNYAKWMIMNTLWHKLNQDFNSVVIQKKFIFLCEREGKHSILFKPLYSAIKKSFVMSTKFYNENKRTSKGIQDESTFFNHTQLNEKFRNFLRTKENSQKDKFITKQLSQFVTSVKKFEMP